MSKSFQGKLIKTFGGLSNTDAKVTLGQLLRAQTALNTEQKWIDMFGTTPGVLYNATIYVFSTVGYVLTAPAESSGVTGVNIAATSPQWPIPAQDINSYSISQGSGTFDILIHYDLPKGL